MRFASALRLLCSAAVFNLGITLSASGVPVGGAFFDDARCDPIPDHPLSHELGEAAGGFPVDELIVIVSIMPGSPICVPGDADIFNDFVVSMANGSPTAWTDVYFVADDGFTLGNADGTVEDVIGASGILSDAVRLDSVGANAPLVFESMTPDGIFEVAETWVFTLTDFTGGPPVFDSLGAFAGSSGGSPPSNASILANPIPEPTAGTLLLAGLAWLGLRRRA